MIIDLFIALLLALSSGTLCEQGTSSVNWGDWIRAHPTAVTVGQIQYDDVFEMWLIDGDTSVEDDGLVLFVFDMDNMPHGQCARRLPPY